ncbi:competence protein ComX [Streptococcus ictaluri]
MYQEVGQDLFDKVKPIILKFKRYYFIQLWDHEDWLQEGRLVLYHLLEAHPELCQEEGRLFTYFKTKFSSYLKDVLRQQESQKRRFHKMPYEEIGAMGHYIASQGLGLDDYVAYQEIIGQVEASLDEKERGQFQALIRGERFAGRQALLRRLRPYFEAFAP